MNEKYFVCHFVLPFYDYIPDAVTQDHIDKLVSRIICFRCDLVYFRESIFLYSDRDQLIAVLASFLDLKGFDINIFIILNINKYHKH